MQTTTADSTVHLPASGTADRVDAAWREVLTDPDVEMPTVIDMSAVTFIEATSLIQIIAQLSLSRQGTADPPRLRLPRSRAVRDFLRGWEFPSACHDVTGRRFYDLVTPDGHKYFGESASRTRLQKLEFPIHSFFSSEHPFGPELAQNEYERWESKNVRTVLDRHFKKRGSQVATHIVHEAMMNAVYHPRATIVATTSRYNDDAKFLTIDIWDDGASVIDTLAGAISEGRPLRSVSAERLYRDITVKYVDHETGITRNEEMSTDYLPDPSTPAELLLLSSTFPGITRDTGQPPQLTHPTVAQEDPLYAFPGMGLFVLTNAALDVFGGQLSIRSRNYFLNLKKPSSPRRKKPERQPAHRAKIARYPIESGYFPGNLLTIRLPLHVES